MLTLNKLNNIFAKDNAYIYLNKGKDYFYFIYWDANLQKHCSKSIMVSKINDLTLDQWMQEYNEFKKEMENI